MVTKVTLFLEDLCHILFIFCHIPLTLDTVSELSSGLHHILDPAELHFMFGTEDRSRVSRGEYELARLEDVSEHVSRVAKRSGQPPPDKAYKLRYDGRNYRFNLQKTKSLLAPQANIHFKEGDSLALFLQIYNSFAGNHTYKMRVTNNSRLLELQFQYFDEDEYYYDYEDGDNSFFSNCDNYIMRSSVIYFYFFFFTNNYF